MPRKKRSDECPIKPGEHLGVDAEELFRSMDENLAKKRKK